MNPPPHILLQCYINLREAARMINDHFDDLEQDELAYIQLLYQIAERLKPYLGYTEVAKGEIALYSPPKPIH
jgi:hypothetical protein